MTSPHTHPAERETPAGEAMREAVARAIREFTAVKSNADGSWTRVLRATPEMLASLLTSSAGPIASELARLTADNQALTDEANADLERRLADRCRIAELEAAMTTLRADHAAEVARLKAKTPFVVTNGERGEDERFRMWSGRAWVWVKPVGYAALFVRKRDANQILPDGDPHDYPDRIRALTLKEAGHE